MHLNKMLEETILESSKKLTLSIPVSSGIDVTKHKEMLIEETEKQLAHLAELSKNTLLLRKYIYEIKEAYENSDIVIVERVDTATTDNLKENQFIVNNNKRGY